MSMNNDPAYKRHHELADVLHLHEMGYILEGLHLLAQKYTGTNFAEEVLPPIIRLVGEAENRAMIHEHAGDYDYPAGEDFPDTNKGGTA